MRNMSNEYTDTKLLLLAEAKALLIQLFIRGDFVPGDITEIQTQGLVNRINKLLYE